VQPDLCAINNQKDGLGWTLFENDRGVAALHFGSDNVASAAMLILPEQKATLAVLVNTAGSALAESICDRMLVEYGYSELDHQVLGPKRLNEPEAVDLPREQLRDHVGRYPHIRVMIDVSLKDEVLFIESGFGNFDLIPTSSNEYLAEYTDEDGKKQRVPGARFLFEDIEGMHVVTFENVHRVRQTLGCRVDRREAGDTWLSRMGDYTMQGYRLKGPETYSRARLAHVEDGNFRLTLFYTSGDYDYFLRIEDSDELVFCGFDHRVGGETISFAHEAGWDVLMLNRCRMVK